ncbi:MAG: hypothetical protein IT369_14580 [Candidatus Latescibacteria bacterium]|nr:hypothetical protein [Candidatus Latescibacterota bacterium]
MASDDLPSPQSQPGAAATHKPESEIRLHQGRPTVFVDGEPCALSGYVVCDFTPAALAQVVTGGYDVYHLPIDTRIPVPWPGTEETESRLDPPGCAAYRAWVEEGVAGLLQADPSARFIVRFYVWPGAAWKAIHENEYTLTEDGPACQTPSLASEAYHRDAAEYIGRIIRYVESRPWADRVIGYVNLAYEEGSHMPVGSGYLFDHNPVMVRCWRQFLREKYETEEQLRAAHGEPTLSFATAEVPCDRLRRTVPEVSGLLYWQQAADNQPLRDYLELCRDLWFRRFRMFGEAMRAALDRRVICLVDALKQSQPGWNHNAFFGGFYDGPAALRGKPCSQSLAWPEYLAGSGHIGIAALLDDMAGFDGVMTPHDYQARGLGGVYEPEGIADSAVLRGRYFVAEMDTRAVFDLFPARNEREWEAITWRNVATGLARGFNSTFLPILGDPEWLASPSLQQTFRRQAEVMRESLAWPHATLPGIAMILDDAAVLETTGAGNYPYEAVMWEHKMGLARCGVPHNIYLFEDLALDNFPRHRVYYFPNLFRVDEERLELLRRKVLGEGAVVVWGPGSGIAAGGRIGVESAARLTGFNFDLYPHNYPRRVLISNFEHPITRGLDAATLYGTSLAFGPVLLPADGDGTELGAAWISRGNNYQVGLAVKEFGLGAMGHGAPGARGAGDYASVFSAAIQLPADLWRNLARYAGGHVYLEENDVFMAGSRVVAVHSLKSGRKHLRLPGPCRVRNLVTGELHAARAEQIEYELRAPETCLFELEPLAS